MRVVPDQYIGILSSCMFAGMMVGAIGWGACEFRTVNITE